MSTKPTPNKYVISASDTQSLYDQVDRQFVAKSNGRPTPTPEAPPAEGDRVTVDEFNLALAAMDAQLRDLYQRAAAVARRPIRPRR